MPNFADKPIAIIGMGCRLPGADNCDEFWKLLIEGRSALGELPASRMNRELQYDPRKGIRTRSYTTKGGVANEMGFQPGECPLPQEVTDVYHTAHITTCNVAAAACRDAGFDPYHLPNRNVGVYIGHTPPSQTTSHVIYARMIEQIAGYLREIPDLDQMAPGHREPIIGEIVQTVRSQYDINDPVMRMRSHAFFGPGLITRAFNLDGPSMAFDAACASSFRALGHGVRALQRGQIDMALVGGASYCHGDTLVVFSQAQSVSANDSRPFDDNASGLIAGGGYVVLAIKTLEKAIADGDNIQAVVCGLGVSSDGKGKSLWAPREEGQIEAIDRAYGPRMRFNEVQFLEMHATSTQVGDATELGALARAAEGQFPAGTKIPIGSVKANIGHTLETAGIASLAKTVLAMKNGVIPPQINVETPNSNIDWDSLPFQIPHQAMQWDRPDANTPRKAAVNAFGIGGLNVHIAMHEHMASTSAVQSVPADIASSDAASPDDDDAVAIIGRGAVFPGTRTIDSLWDTIRSGADQKQEAPAARWSKEQAVRPGETGLWQVPTAVGGFITDFEYDWKKHKVPPKQIASADPLQFMLLDGADQAMRDAGYDDKEYDRKRTGVIVGTTFGGEFGDSLAVDLRVVEFQKLLAERLQARGVPADQIEKVCADFEDVMLKHMPALIDETGSFTASTLASRISKTFDLMGGAVAVDSGDASSLAAINCCVDVLLAGDCDMMICAAGQRAMGLATFESMQRTGRLSQGDPVSPFDAQATGCVPGEGVGVVLLKRLSDARRDGDTVHGVIRGIGVARSESLRESIREAIQRSQDSAGIGADAVSVIEAGSYGNPENDQAEIEAVVDCYGTGTRHEPIQVGAVSAQMGNLGGGSGIASILKGAAELSSVEVPGLKQLQAPISSIGQNAQTLRMEADNTPIPPLNEDGRLYAGVTSYAQHNVAYHMLMEGPVKVPRTATVAPASDAAMAAWQPDQSTRRLVRIGGASVEAVSAELQSRLDESGAVFAEADSRAFSSTDRWRLVIVAASAEELQSKMKIASSQLTNPDAAKLLNEKGIFFNEVSRTRPQVAFVFPGQGSQYNGMLKSLVDDYAPAAEALRKADRVLARLNLPSFGELAWAENDDLGEDVWKTQLSLLIADTIVCSAVESVGLRADRVGGHSFGELAALVAAGSWTFEDAIRATSARCDAINACQNAEGSLVSTTAPAEVATECCREVGGNLTISHFNAPEQIVLGGDTPAVEQLAKLLKDRGFRAKILEVPAPFHTPMMEEVKVPFGEGLEPIPLAPPRIPLLSTVTNRYVAEPSEIRENLVLQMTMPVDYIRWVERLAAEGTSVLIEVGPRQVLTGLNRQILEGSDELIIGCDHPKRNGFEQLLNVRAAMESIGALDWPEHAVDIDAGLPPEAETAGSSETSETAAPQEAAPAVAVNEVPSIEASEPQPETAATEPEAEPNPVQLVELSGSPYDIGRRLGEVNSQAIRQLLRREADLAGSLWDRVADIEEATMFPDVYFGKESIDEMNGMADGAGIAAKALIAHNLRLYLGTCAGGLHFATAQPAEPSDGMLHGMNEDLSKALKLQDCLTRNIQVRRPVDGLPHVAVCSEGQIGTLCGVNARGIAVTTATLLDAEQAEKPDAGRLISVVVARILKSASNINEAVEIVKEVPVAGAWTLCISHYPTGHVCYVEFDGKSMRVQPSLSWAVSSNQQLLTNYTMQTFADSVPKHSVNRRNRFVQLLGGDGLPDATAALAKSALRDRFDVSQGIERSTPNMHTVRRIDNQISVVVQPAEQLLWVTAGSNEVGDVDVFHRIDLKDLLPELADLDTVSGSTDSVATAALESIELDATLVSDAYAAAEQRADGQSDICSRFVMRTVECPLVQDPADALLAYGPVLILGENEDGMALASMLQQCGLTVYVIPTAHGDAAAAVGTLEQCWQAGPAPHLFLMTPRDEDAVTQMDPAAWQSRQERGVMLPYLVTQRWFQLVSESDLFQQASLIAVTSMGGDFGLSGNVTGAEGGALTGLVKGVRMELQMSQRVEKFRARILDAAASEDPQSLAAFICQEFVAADDEIEVGLKEGRRLVVRPVPVSVPPESSLELPPQANVVVTGGARGITAAVARELGKKLGARLHLIGSSPVPAVAPQRQNLTDEELQALKPVIMKEALDAGEKPIDAWSRFEKAIEIDKTLRSFAEVGVHAEYHACDISDRTALSQLLDQIRAEGGPIYGVVHGAGYERATRFEKKNPDLVRRTVAVKVDGAAALMQLTANDPVAFFAAFGSVSGRFGGVGQTDYSMANDCLAKLVDWYRTQRPETRSATFHWHAWDDVGMAVRPESKHIRELHDIAFMPAVEGVRHLLDEMSAGFPEREIAITELHTCSNQFASLPAGAAAQSNLLPMIDAVSEQDDRSLTAELKLDPVNDVFLAQHRFRGRPLLPIVVGMDALAQVASQLVGPEKHVVEISDIEIINGLKFVDDNPQTAKLKATAAGDFIQSELTCDLYNRKGQLVQADRPYLNAKISVSETPLELERSITIPTGEWNDIWYPEEDLVIYHGPVFRCLRQVAPSSKEQAWARLVAPPLGEIAGSRGTHGWKMPSAVLDGCFFSCGIFLWLMFDGVVAIPAGIDRIRISRLPKDGEQCLARLRFRDREGDKGVFDVNLYGEDGSAILEVEGYRNIIVSKAPVNAQ